MISNATLLDWMKADAADTAMLRLLEQAAIKALEKMTGRCLGVTQTITETIRFRSWPLALSNNPIGGVLTSLSQWDGTAFTTVTASNYSVEGSFVYPNSTFAWPIYPPFPPTVQKFRAVYQAGYTVDGSDANVWAAPQDIQQAVLLLVGHWFENRESVVVGTTASEVPMSVQALVSPWARVAV